MPPSFYLADHQNLFSWSIGEWMQKWCFRHIKRIKENGTLVGVFLCMHGMQSLLPWFWSRWFPHKSPKWLLTCSVLCPGYMFKFGCYLTKGTFETNFSFEGLYTSEHGVNVWIVLRSTQLLRLLLWLGVVTCFSLYEPMVLHIFQYHGLVGCLLNTTPHLLPRHPFIADTIMLY